MAAAIAVLVFVLVDRPSLQRIGLSLPTGFGAGLVLAVSFASAILLMLAVHWAGGQIPANPMWPSLHLAWKYVVWALIQEFMILFLHALRRIVWEFGGGVGRGYIVRRRSLAQSYPYDGYAAGGFVFLRDVPALSKHLCHRYRARGAGIDDCRDHAGQPLAQHAGGDWLSALLTQSFKVSEFQRFRGHGLPA
jgi:hypothetical protein